MLRELQNIILLRDWRKPTGRAEWSVGILGGVIALIGIILALGGAKLIGAGGSWYYLFAGLALIVAGLAVAQRKLLGAWIYAGAFVVTALWAFWEVGLTGWALVPRLVGPLVLLLLVILSLPVLDANHGRRRRLFGLSGFGLIVIVLGVAVAQANLPDAPGPMPEPFVQAMADASLMQVGANWPAYGGTYNAQRYSPLDQIDRNNVRGLERAWTFRTGDMPKERWGAETTHHCGDARRAANRRRCAHRNAVCGFRQERRRRYHNRHGRNRTEHGVYHLGADHRQGRGHHRPAGSRRPARGC